MKMAVLLVFIGCSGFGQNFLGTGKSTFQPESRSSRMPVEFRKVGTNIYNISTADNWSRLDNLKIFSVEAGGLILSEDDKLLFVKNAPGHSYADGQVVYLIARLSGTTKTTYGTLELWDCGIPCDPPPPTPEEVAAAKGAQELQNKRQLEIQTKLYQAQSNAIRTLIVDAHGGSTSAQYSLAIHYLNGQGCETNREQAIYWMKQAADAGDVAASNKLSAITLKLQKH